MKNLFDRTAVDEVRTRLGRLSAANERQWGKMGAAQALAHCSGAFEVALGDKRPPRMLLGRIIGGIIRPKVLGDDAPLRRNSPTVPALVVDDERNLETERERLLALVSRFQATGPARCTTHPHSFFGRLKGEEWAVLMYKHVDHHLRQFGV